MQTPEVLKLRNWLVENTNFPKDADNSLDLIESGALTSLQMMEFILFLEHLSGQQVDLDRSTLTKMKSIETIVENYLTTDDNSEAVA